MSAPKPPSEKKEQGAQTLSELAARLEFHPNMIAQWKRQAAQGMVEAFSSTLSRREDHRVGRNRVVRLMRKMGLTPLKTPPNCPPNGGRLCAPPS